MRVSIDDYMKPFYLGRWVPKHVKNSSPMRIAELSRILLFRNEVVETRLHHVYGGKKGNYHKTVVPIVRKRKCISVL